MKRIVTLCALLVATPIATSAPIVPHLNTGFESGVTGDCQGTSGAMSWTVTGSFAGHYNPCRTLPFAPFTAVNDFGNVSDLPAPGVGIYVGDVGESSSLCQDVGGTVTFGNTYTLTAVIGNRTMLGFNSTYKIEIRGTVTGTPVATGASPIPPLGTLVTDTAVYTPGATDPELGNGLTVCLTGGTGFMTFVDFDEVQLTPVELMSFSID